MECADIQFSSSLQSLHSLDTFTCETQAPHSPVLVIQVSRLNRCEIALYFFSLDLQFLVC